MFQPTYIIIDEVTNKVLRRCQADSAAAARAFLEPKTGEALYLRVGKQLQPNRKTK